MNTFTYIGIIILAIGFFVWLFGISKMGSAKNSFAPISPSKIRNCRVINVVGAILFFGGIVLTFCTYGA